MASTKRFFAKAPEGTGALFFIQIFATLGFAVLYSTLVRFSPKPNRRLPKFPISVPGLPPKHLPVQP